MSRGGADRDWVDPGGVDRGELDRDWGTDEPRREHATNVVSVHPFAE